MTLLRRVPAAGFTITAVVGDAAFGEDTTLRRRLHRAKLPYALGVSAALTVFLAPPPPRTAARYTRPRSAAHASRVVGSDQADHGRRSRHRAAGVRLARDHVAQRTESTVAHAIHRYTCDARA